MSEDKIDLLPVWFVRRHSCSVFTLLYGLLRVINIGSIGVVTICGVAILIWKPSPV